jgi:two-component system KDP operon response regulator KdpE
MDPAGRAPVLVADGDEANRTVLRLACESAGISVVEAATGAAALRLAAAGTYTAIILGADLPDIPGIEVCRRVRTGDTVTPILVAGGHRAPGQVELAGAGADGHVATPYNLGRLVARLHAYRDPAATGCLLPGVPPAREVRLKAGH